jgi:hypothetical protein
MSIYSYNITDEHKCESDITSAPLLQIAPKVRLPEHALMLAILEDAIHLVRPRSTWAISKSATRPSGLYGRPEIEATACWFTTERDDGVFSFENICSELGLDAGALRRAVLAGYVPRSEDSGQATRRPRPSRAGRGGAPAPHRSRASRPHQSSLIGKVGIVGETS